MAHKNLALLAVVMSLLMGSTPPPIASGQCSPQQLIVTGRGWGVCCGDGQWDDSSDVDFIARPISRIEIWSDDEVRGIRITYDGYATKIHGGKGASPAGTRHVIDLQPGEFVNNIEGRAGSRIDQLCLTTNYKAEQCFGGSGGDYFSEAGTQQGRPLRGIGGASGDSLDNIVFHYSPYSQLDISTFKYKQSDLDQALATAPVKVYASDTRVSGPTPLTVTFNATHQLQHTETLQLTRALTSSTTQTATIGFTLSASTPGSEVSILGKTGLKKVLTEAAGGGGGNGANGSFSYSWTDSITNTSQQTVADQSQDSTGWTATFTLPGNMQGQLVTTWKQVSLDLRVTYDLVYYNDNNSEVCRNTVTGRLVGSGSSSLTHNFVTAALGSKDFKIQEVRPNQRPYQQKLIQMQNER